MFKSGSKISATNENSHDLCPFFRFRAARFPWNSSTKAWMHADSKSFAGCSEETSVWVEDVQLKTDMIEIPGKKNRKCEGRKSGGLRPLSGNATTFAVREVNLLISFNLKQRLGFSWTFYDEVD